MKFLTEYDLRLKYQEHPFDNFTVTGETRLTPGARQFLIDRKIKIIDERFQKDVLKKNNKDPILNRNRSNNEESLTALDWLQLRSEVLDSASRIEKADLILAQELCSLEKCLSMFSQNQEFLLPSAIQLKDAKTVDEQWLEDRLSSVSMYLQSQNGPILTVLYSLYFKMKKTGLQLTGDRISSFESICSFIAQLIAHYLERDSHEN